MTDDVNESEEKELQVFPKAELPPQKEAPVNEEPDAAEEESIKPEEEEGKKEKSLSWIGVDLDGTLAKYEDWEGIYKIGEPIPAMVERVKKWIAEGKNVRIITARVGPGQSRTAIFTARMAVKYWCQKHLGKRLPVTAYKDYNMKELWDDRAIGVIRNTGQRADGKEE